MLNATRAALFQEGVVPGCGALFTNMAADKDLPDWIRVALMAPICKIMSTIMTLALRIICLCKGGGGIHAHLL